MKWLAPFSLILIAACASSSGFDERRGLDCSTGEVEARVGFAGPGTHMENVDDRLTISVEVSNNSHNDITVKWVRVEQIRGNNTEYFLDNGYGAFNETIPEADDHVFELSTKGQAQPNLSRRTQPESQLQLLVLFGLENGETYRCRFLVPSPLF